MARSKPKIAVIVPTIRPDHFENFVHAWLPTFAKHAVDLYCVRDGDDPAVNGLNILPVFDSHEVAESLLNAKCETRNSMFPNDRDNIFSDHNPACRNLGFYYAAWRDRNDIFITLDDDCLPIDGFDTIQAHLNVLNRKWPMSWMSTSGHEDYMRGFPYGIRSEAEAVVSHGYWKKNPDFDAPTELQERYCDAVYGEDLSRQFYYQGPIPRGVFYPHCGMNVAFKRCVLPYYYHCPVEDFPGAQRFDDIWMGLELKKKIDSVPEWCVVSGYAEVIHSRASNPFKNLQREAVGIDINERLWKGEIDEQYAPFFELYQQKREAYEKLMQPLV